MVSDRCRKLPLVCSKRVCLWRFQRWRTWARARRRSLRRRSPPVKWRERVPTSVSFCTAVWRWRAWWHWSSWGGCSSLHLIRPRSVTQKPATSGASGKHMSRRMPWTHFLNWMYIFIGSPPFYMNNIPYLFSLMSIHTLPLFITTKIQMLYSYHLHYLECSWCFFLILFAYILSLFPFFSYSWLF